MKRQVYKRHGEGAWKKMHAPAPKDGEPGGFEDLCGFSEDEIYAVGWQGEIWQWDGKAWTQRKSPTDVILTAACCSDGVVYACGQDGTLVRGRHDKWERVDIAPVSWDLWDVCAFDGKVYLASMDELVMYDNGAIGPVDFGDDPPRTCGKLTHAKGVLWSVGTSDVLSFDGKAWTRIDPAT
jgi:hypothetical protein